MNEQKEALVLDTEEEKVLADEVSSCEAQAKAIVIANDADFAAASEFLKSVKSTLKKVKDYWEPLRISAKKTYDDVLAKKKQMTSPLENTEKILKGKIGEYTLEQERKRKEEEERLRKLAEAEREKKIQDAIEAEESGDLVGAEMAMAEAEIYDDASVTAAITKQAPKAQGISTRKDWIINVVDESKVPVDISGMVIRPVDESAVLKLVRASKGKIVIPGIEIKETVTVSARSN